MKYKKDIKLQYNYIGTEQSKTALDGMFDRLITEIHKNLKFINEKKKEYCSLSDFSASDYPEFLRVQLLTEHTIDIESC